MKRIAIHTKKIIGVLFIVAGISACSTSQLRVSTQPEGADVLLVQQGQPPRKIGVTPMVMDEQSLGLDRQSYELSFSKQGHQSQGLLVPASLAPRNINLNVVLTEAMDHNKAQSIESLQKLASGIAQAQSYVKTKSYDLAEQTLMSLLTNFNAVPTVHELLGNVHYLRRDTGKALGYYRRAMELDPRNVDTQRIVQKLESLVNAGGRGISGGPQ